MIEYGSRPDGDSGDHPRLLGEMRIPFFDGRPRREESISKDDVTNLLIALNTTSSLEEFIEQV